MSHDNAKSNFARAVELATERAEHDLQIANAQHDLETAKAESGKIRHEALMADREAEWKLDQEKLDAEVDAKVKEFSAINPVLIESLSTLAGDIRAESRLKAFGQLAVIEGKSILEIAKKYGLDNVLNVSTDR